MNPLFTSNVTPATHRVLLVDNENIILHATTRMLSKFCSVDIATDAVEALRLIDTTAYHAVITDYDMPGQNGIWLLDAIKDKYPQVRRILHSGSDPVDVARHIRTGTVQHFLPKPADLDEILSTL